MPTLGQQNEEPAMLPVAAFRDWTLSRPDEQHWELIDGVPIMMAPPTLDHQRIASNLERLLNDAIAALPQPRLPPIAAYQRIGVNLGPAVEGYDPEPDVAVVEIPAIRQTRYADRVLLVAEVISPSDTVIIAGKREIYKLIPDCRCILVVQQDRYAVAAERRSAAGWTREVLSAADDRLTLPEFALRCTLSEIYKGTAVAQMRK